MRIPSRTLMTLLLALATIATFSLTAEAANKEIVRFRLEKWKSAHFKSAKKAEEHFTIMKSIGCEAKRHKHGDHVDVKYRCTKWRQLNLKSHAEAHRWEKWLKYYGFQTQHKH